MTKISHGMNPDEVESLAGELRRMGDELDRVARSLDSRVRTVDWTGPVGGRFKQQWWPKHRSTLVRAAADLRGFADSAQTNAAEQRRVSGSGVGAAGGGAPTGGTWTDDVRRVGSSLSELDEHVVGPLGALFGSLGALERVSDGAPMLRHAPAFSRLGTGLGYVSIGASTVQAVDSLSRGHYVDAAFSGGDAAASGFKASKHPYAYLGGVTAQTWLEAGRAARQVDWSPTGIRQIADATPSDWAKAFGEAIAIELPKRIPKIYAP